MLKKNKKKECYTRKEIIRKICSSNSYSHIEVSLKQLSVYTVLIILADVMMILSTYLYKIYVDEIITNQKFLLLKSLILEMIIVFAFRICCNSFSSKIVSLFSNSVNLKVREKVFKKILNKKICILINNDAANYQKIIESDATLISNFFLDQIAGRVVSSLFVIIYFSLLLKINSLLSIVVLISFPITYSLGRIIGKMFNEYSNKLRAIEEENITFIYGTIQKWREIKINVVEKLMNEQYKEKLQPEKNVNIKWMKYHALEKILFAIKNDFFQTLLLFSIGGMLIIFHKITIGDLLMFISIVGYLSTNIDKYISVSTQFSANQAAFRRLFTLLEVEEKEDEGNRIYENELLIRDLSFAYSSNLPTIINNMTYCFEKNKRYFLVGKSGEGKSTFVKLLLRMYEPKCGNMYLGGVDVKNVIEKDYFNLIGAVMQDNYFFNLSIRENLLLLNENASKEDIKAALNFACIDDFVESLPEKYDTVIGERGIKLSGGQKQRLAIARMILHKPSIMIFDEATSAIDTVTEKKILGNLDNLENTTIIFISHKSAIHFKFDTKLILQEGKIQEIY